MPWIWIIVGLIGLWLIFVYNGLVTLRNRVRNSYAQIDVQLKRRADLIPNLVETVKGYVQHEQGVLERVTQARSAILGAQSPRQAAEADNMLTGALKSLFAVSEAYPELKANENFMMLQEELAGTENKVAYARQAYNDAVLVYHNGIEKFPANMMAGAFGFRHTEYYEVAEADRQPVKVKF